MTRPATRSAPEPLRTPLVVLASLVLLLAVPRILRMLHPQIWIEDDSYLHNAFLVARGRLPYRDFPLPHLPLLEALMAAVFRVAPISIRTAEAVTQATAFAASILVLLLGRRLDGLLTGSLAATIFAASALLFRYHLFEREVFVIVPVLAAALVTFRSHAPGGSTAGRDTRDAIAAGMLMFLAVSVKLTAIAAFAAVLLYLVAEGKRRSAIVLTMTTLGLFGIATAALTAAFGDDFLVQVFLFRTVHATFPSLGVKLDELRYSMDISLAFGVAGVALILWRGSARRWAGPLLQLVCGFVLLVLVNPTYWAHTGIELLPWLSLTAGYLVADFLRVALPRAGARRMRVPGRTPGHLPRKPTPALVCGAAAILAVIYVSPIRNLNWEAGDGAVYGFGYRDRREIEAISQYVQAHSAPDALVATPPIIAFAANREEAIPYAEVAGSIDELTAAVRRNGYWAAFLDEASRITPLWEEVESSRNRMAPVLLRLLVEHRVAVLINDSPDDLIAVPLIDVSPEDLKRYGYQLESVWAHYDAWMPHPAHAR